MDKRWRYEVGFIGGNNMDFTELTEYLSRIDHNLIPDCEIAVYKDHECIYKNSFTKPDYNPDEAKKDTYFLFSATKVITCTSAMRLVEEGKLGLDDPVSKYLPEFANLYVKSGNNDKVPAKNTLTVRHLFSMQGGFNYNFRYESIQKVISESNNQASTREIVAAIAQMPLEFEPGTNFHYSLCHDILAAVVEVAAGKKFSKYLNEVIFEPLGMKDTTFVLTDDIRSRMKQQYSVDPVTFTAVPKEATCAYCLSENYESGGAGLISTLEDYVKFIDAMACGESKDGYRILKPETIELMKTNQLGEKSLKTFRANTHNKGYGYGLGVRTMMDQNIENSQSPFGEFGWDGAAGAYCLIDTENHLSIFYAQHVLGCSYAYSTVHKAIRNLVYKALEK